MQNIGLCQGMLFHRKIVQWRRLRDARLTKLLPGQTGGKKVQARAKPQFKNAVRVFSELPPTIEQIATIDKNILGFRQSVDGRKINIIEGAGIGQTVAPFNLRRTD